MPRPVILAAIAALAAGLAACGPPDEPDTTEMTTLTRAWMAAVALGDGASICATYAHSGDGPTGCVAAVDERLADSALADIPGDILRKGSVSIQTGGTCCIATAVVTTSEPDFRRTVLLLDSENPGNSFLVAQDPLCGSRECGRAR